MTILGINLIALFLGAVLLAPRHDSHGHLWRYAREQARSERKRHFSTCRRSHDLGGANTSVRGEARLFRRITSPRVRPMRQS
jgi:hypothetical protein